MAKETAGSVVDEIRSSLKNPSGGGGSGGMPQQQAFIPPDGKKRFRWLSEFSEAIKIKMHDKFGTLFPQPCLKYYGKKCPFCDGAYRTRVFYAWTVYEYAGLDPDEGSDGRRRILLSYARPGQLMEDLLEIFDNNSTVKDRDLTVARIGKRQDTRYKVREVQKEKTKFEGDKTKAFSKDKVFAILAERMITSAKGLGKEEEEEEEKGGDDDE